MKIRFESIYDSHDCETCGSSFAEGGKIYFDNKLKFKFKPSAHCYDSEHMDERELVKKAFELLGHEVQFD